MHTYEFSDRVTPCTALLNSCTLINFWHILYEILWEIFRNDLNRRSILQRFSDREMSKVFKFCLKSIFYAMNILLHNSHSSVEMHIMHDATLFPSMSYNERVTPLTGADCQSLAIL